MLALLPGYLGDVAFTDPSSIGNLMISLSDCCEASVAWLLFLLLRRRRSSHSETSTRARRTTKPPTAPPTTAPTFTDSCGDVCAEPTVPEIDGVLAVRTADEMVVELECVVKLKVSFHARKGAASAGLLLKNAPARSLEGHSPDAHGSSLQQPQKGRAMSTHV